MVLKANRNYKELVSKEEVKAYVRDMEQSKESKAYQDQVKEFGAFLDASVGKEKPFQFLVDMHKKHVEGVVFTDNMASAVRKCMKREQEWQAKQKASEVGTPEELPTITLKIKPFIMKSLNLDSRVITGKVKAESAKAWLVEGYADMVEHMSWCARCGRQLTEPASQVTGYGQVCAEKLGVPYDQQDVLSMTKRQRTAIRKRFVKKLQQQKFEAWLPKSQAEVLTKELL